MTKGTWVWPSEPRAQRRVLRQVLANPHMIATLSAIAKSKEGMSNAEIDDVIGDNAEWMTLWVIRQLTSLGFVDFNVDFFGNPARYRLTDLGKSAFAMMTGQPPAAPRPPPASPAPPVQVAASKTA